MRRRKFEFLTVLGLIAVLLSSTAGFATAPVAKDIPDIRSAVNGTGSVGSVLDLDDYVVDPDDRDQTTSAQLPLTWGENTSGDDNVAIIAGNELEVTVPASNAPESGVTTFSIQDASADTVFTDPVTVKTADFLLGGPLVDSYLVVGGTETSPIPYSWCCDESKTLRIDGVTQGGSAGGRLYASVSSGIGSTCFISGSSILSGTDLTQPVNPYEPGVTTRGVAAGTLATVSLNAANISVDADLNGMFVQCLAGFSDWVRVSVTRTFDSGAKDCYSVAVGDVLLGSSTTNFSGTPAGDATIVGSEEVYGFDNITLNDLIGANTVADYESNPNIDDQSTSWIAAAVGQTGNTLNGATLGELSLTTSVPASSYPGSNNNRALCVELDQPDLCGILLQHKGIDPASISPGDVITLSMNIYVDLNYGGSVSADEINEASNAPAIAMGLGTQPGLEAVNFNFVSFPLSQATLASLAPGGVFSGDYGAGGSAVTNPVAGLHGKWTRHEVSLRVPESGFDYNGPAGSGNIAYPNGLTALILLGRVDTGLNAHPQRIYLDNVCITKTPGSLVLAEGATSVPMISAGWGFAGEDGNSFNTGLGSVGGTALPASIARGEVIYGSFSDEAPSNDPTTVLGNAANTAYSQLGGNAAAGWLEGFGNTDLGFIAQGSTDVALAFPTLTSGNKSLCLAADPGTVSGNYPNPNTSLGSTHGGAVSVVTPYLDMRLAASAVLPALNVNDVNFAAGTGGVNDQNSIPGNVSGVFGVRFFHHTNAAEVAQNPSLSLTLTNADETSGLVATRQSNVLTTGSDNSYSGIVWLDDMLTGSVASFYSGQRYYDLVLNSGSGVSRFSSGGNSALATSLQSQNPGAQLAIVQAIKGPSLTYLTHQSFEAAGFNAYQDAFGTGTTNDSALPGIIGTATVFVDEVGLHAVRDSGAFYDEDLCVLP